MTNYPQDIITAYAERKISRGQFENKLAEWQKKRGRDYSCKGTADKQGVYLTYRNITAIIKNDTLHFKTYAADTARTPFEFRRKVDFYKEAKKKAFERALATMNFYFDKAGAALRNSDSNSYRANIDKARDWALIVEERTRIWP